MGWLAAVLAAAGMTVGVERTPAVTPFVLPPSATLVTERADGGGWTANGEMKLAFASAQARLTTSVAAAGWTHRHTIDLGRNRILDAWTRGAEELTVMVWRISAGRSGFSYGLSSGDGKAGRPPRDRRRQPAAATAAATNTVKLQEVKDGRGL